MSCAEQMKLVKGDITRLSVDAVVNAANEALRGGGGVDGAIHRAAGPELLAACRELGGCPTGEARITDGFRLPAAYVIHTVGPVWSGGGAGEDALLESSYNASLDLALEHSLKSIAFPCISTGVYGFPFERARDIAVGTVVSKLETSDTKLEVTFCCFSESDFSSYEVALSLLQQCRV